MSNFFREILEEKLKENSEILIFIPCVLCKKLGRDKVYPICCDGCENNV